MNKSSAVAEMGDGTRAKWSEKWGLMFLFPWGRAGSPSNTMSPGPRPTSTRSGTVVSDPSSRLATMHQRYNTDRQRSDSIGRTILQLECGPMPNVMAALPNIGGALFNAAKLADAHYYRVPCSNAAKT